MTTRTEEPRESAPPKKVIPKWTRTDVNFWLDCVLGLVFLGLVAITMLIRFAFPRAQDSLGWTLWGYSYDDLIQAQFVVLAVLTLLILVHVMLHWNWLCSVAQQRVLHSAQKKTDNGWQTIVGVGLMIVLLNVLGILLGVAMIMIRHSS
jgi:hypothetical protein